MKTDDEPTGMPKTKTLSAYRKEKLRMLKKDFKINLTDTEIYHMFELKTESAIDQFCLSAIDRHWN